MSKPSNWQSIIDELSEQPRSFSPATIAYWTEWLECREQYPPTTEDLWEFISTMEHTVAEGLPDLIPSHFISGEDDEPAAPTP